MRLESRLSRVRIELRLVLSVSDLTVFVNVFVTVPDTGEILVESYKCKTATVYFKC